MGLNMAYFNDVICFCIPQLKNGFSNKHFDSVNPKSKEN